jgi:hypothetical protein
MARKGRNTVKKGTSYIARNKMATRINPTEHKAMRSLVSRPSMPVFPNEIIMVIAEFLKPEQIGNFRLCCRAFSNIALPYLLRQVAVFRHPDSLAWLDMLSQDPLLSQHVRSLHFDIDGLKEPAAPFDKYVQKIQKLSRSKSHSRFKPAVYNQPLTRHSLKRSYMLYERAVNFQTYDIRQKQVDFVYWAGAMKAFHNLDSLTISSGSCIWRHPRAKNPFRAYCIDSKTKYQTLNGKHEFFGLLVLAGVSKRNLKSLQAGLLHWSTFACSNEPTPAYLLLSLKHLTRLNLVFGVETDNVQENPIESCNLYLSKGGLAMFIKQLPTLEELVIGFNSLDAAQGTFGASSEMILHPDGHWPHLHSLDLTSISLDADYMATFFKNHRGSLKDLCLTNFSLSDFDTLREFLSSIRDTLVLRNFEVFGYIWSPNEDNADVEDLWDMGDRGHKHELRDAVKRFVLNEGYYPLFCEDDEESSSDEEDDSDMDINDHDIFDF